MSTALAIASVTAVLKDLLNNGVIDHDLTAITGNEVVVSALPPDRIDALDQNPTERKSRLNLFLYQVTPNAGWRNVGLPSRDARGERVSNPPLALDLHYILTAYGAEDTHAEILLGYGMQLFHETPVLTRAAIRTALAPPTPIAPGGDLPSGLRQLFTSELAEQVEQIKITPQSLTTEEISRMWTAFQAKYRPASAYQASVVLIESKQPTRSPLPVLARKVFVVQLSQPVIEQIKSQAAPGDPIVVNQPILSGHNLVISGSRLRADDIRVNIGGIERQPADADVTDIQIILPVPAELQAGVQGVQVIHRRLMGSPLAPHRGVDSNVAAFVLRPKIEAITLSNLQGTGANPRSADVTLAVSPAIGDLQRVVLLLNELVVLSSPPQEVRGESYSFVAPSRITSSPPTGPPGSSQTITIPIKGVKAGTYLVRVQIDGAESVLETDVNGQFASPKVTIP